MFWISTKRIEENAWCDGNGFNHVSNDCVDWRIDDGMAMVLVLKGCWLNARFLMQEVDGAGDCSCINKKHTKNIRTNGSRDT